MAELASSSAEQPASKFTFDVNLETNEVEVKYKGNSTWTHITKWNCGVVPATDDLQIDKELHKIKTLQKTFHDNLRVKLTRIRNRIHCILFVFGHDNLDSAFQMAIKFDRVKATISEFLQEIYPNLKNSSLSCWIGEQNESSEHDNKNSDEKSESIVFSVTDNRKGCTSETDWSCSFGHDEFEIDLTSSRRTFTKLKSMFQKSYRCFLKLVRRGSLIIECEHESREDALEMMKNHVKVKATILECLHEMDPRVNAIKIEVEYREIERDHLAKDPSPLPEPGHPDRRFIREQKYDQAENELKQEIISLKKRLRVTSKKLAELQRAKLSGTQMPTRKRPVSPPSSDSSGFGSASERASDTASDISSDIASDTDTVVGDEDLQDIKGSASDTASETDTVVGDEDLQDNKAPDTDTGREPWRRDTPQGSDQPGGASSHPSEMEALRHGATQESELPVYSREEETQESGTPLGRSSDTPATPTPARRDPEADRHLRDASREGDMAAVKRILAAGRADVNCRDVVGLTPVMVATERRHRDVVELLVSEGADVSLVGEDGDHILHHACGGGDVETVKYVLSLHVADINSRGWRSRTPVMWAALRGHRDVVELLVSEGADVSLVNEFGNNVLHYACMGGDVETVKFVLFQNVVDIDARNNAGQTAADVARDKGHQKIVKLLQPPRCHVM